MDGILIMILFFVIIIALAIAVLAVTNRIIFKMAVRNFTRRKIQSVIVIGGLMIGTAIISSSLIVQDTMVYMFEIDVYRSLGEVDEDIWGLNSFGTVEYFNESIYESLADNLSSADGIEAIAPVIADLGSVFDANTLLGDPLVALLGLDSQILKETSFGDLDDHGFYPDTLSEGETAINSRLADEIDASEGDSIVLSYREKDLINPQGFKNQTKNFIITKIINEKDLWGKANYNQRKTVFFEMDNLQPMLNRSGEINHIWISNDGDYQGGESVTKKVNQKIEHELDKAVKNDNALTGKNLVLEVHNVKADNLEIAREGGETIGIMFMIFGTFSIIAGIVLIINIFVMLGEERKSEMGMARAVGMKSKHLVRMYLFEGSIYAFLAAVVGGFLGLGLGKALILGFNFIFSALEEEVGGGTVDIPFYFEWDSVILAMCIGLIITFITIFFISTRITKLNIIRAIRRIPEPKKPRAEKRLLIIGGFLTFWGIIFTYYAFSTLTGSAWMMGYPLLVLGLSLVAHKWVSIRASMTVAGFAIIIMFLQPFSLPVISEMDFTGVEGFVLSGVFLVLAGVFIVMFNSNILLLTLQKTIGRGKSTRAVLKTAISYPMDNKFKTGMTLGMFALIIFTVTVIAMIAAMQASIGDNMLREQSGGYDVMGEAKLTSFQNLTLDNLPPELSNIDIEELETISSALVDVVDYDRRQTQGTEYGPPTSTGIVTEYKLLGVSPEFMANNGFTLESRDANFTSDRDAWLALNEGGSFCIVDGNRLEGGGIQVGPPVEQGGVYVGGTITISEKDKNVNKTLKVIGIMDQSLFFSGIIVDKDTVKNDYGGLDKIVVIKLGPDEDADFVAKEFEKAYLAIGLQTFDMKGIIDIILDLMNNMMYLMEGFLGIGLLIGIAGIGIVSYRNVIERRQQIGMLRAIGFRKRMITKAFLIETSFITILAMLIGIILGIGIGWNIYRDSGYSDEGVSFVIPWGNLLAISIIAYIATLIFTFYPSIKAAKVPPAEALRYIE